MNIHHSHFIGSTEENLIVWAQKLADFQTRKILPPLLKTDQSQKRKALFLKKNDLYWPNSQQSEFTQELARAHGLSVNDLLWHLWLREYAIAHHHQDFDLKKFLWRYFYEITWNNRTSLTELLPSCLLMIAPRPRSTSAPEETLVLDHQLEEVVDSHQRPVVIGHHLGETEVTHDLWSIQENKSKRYLQSPLHPYLFFWAQNENLEIVIGHHEEHFFNPEGAPLFWYLEQIYTHAQSPKDVFRIITSTPAMAGWSLWIRETKLSVDAKKEKIIRYDLKENLCTQQHFELNQDNSLFASSEKKNHHPKTYLWPLEQFKDYRHDYSNYLHWTQESYLNQEWELTYYYLQMAISHMTGHDQVIYQLFFHLLELKFSSKVLDLKYLYQEIDSCATTLSNLGLTYYAQIAQLFLLYLSKTLKLPYQDFKLTSFNLENIAKSLLEQPNTLIPQWTRFYKDFKKNFYLDFLQKEIYFR